MDSKRPSQDELPPLDLEYARYIVKSALELERVQKMLPLVPKELKSLLTTQETSFLYGVATMGQALHDLLGKDILLGVAELLKNHKDNELAVNVGAEAVRMVAMLEAIGYLSCKEITERAEKQ